MKLSADETKQVKQMVDQYGLSATLRGYLKSHDADRSAVLRDIGRQGTALTFRKLFGISAGEVFEQKKPGLAGIETPATGAAPSLERGEPTVSKEPEGSDVHGLMNKLVKMTKTYKVPLPVLMAMIKTESQFNPGAKGTSGERGLLQLMPKTAQAMGLTVSSKQDDRLDPVKNIESALKYMQTLRTRYGAKTADDVLGGYNAGPSRIKKQGYKQIASTVDYIKKIKTTAREYESDPNMIAADLMRLHANIKGLNP